MIPRGIEPRDPEGTARRNRTDPPPDEYSNPAGVGGDTCDVDDAALGVEPCDPSAAEDLVLEESKPGYGISGFEGEEVGGG